MDSLKDIINANRQDLIAYLESWGMACYDHEDTSLLRVVAIGTFVTEGC